MVKGLYLEWEIPCAVPRYSIRGMKCLLGELFGPDGESKLSQTHPSLHSDINRGTGCFFSVAQFLATRSLTVM
jgi:hypothetical protein